MARVGFTSRERFGSGHGAGAWRRRRRSSLSAPVPVPFTVEPDLPLDDEPVGMTRAAPSQPPPLTEPVTDADNPPASEAPTAVPSEEATAATEEAAVAAPVLEDDPLWDEPDEDEPPVDQALSQPELVLALDGSTDPGPTELTVDDGPLPDEPEPSAAPEPEEDTEATAIPLPAPIPVSLADEPLPWPVAIVAPTLVPPGAWPPPPGSLGSSEVSAVALRPGTDELPELELESAEEAVPFGVTSVEEPPVRGTLDGMPVVQRVAVPQEDEPDTDADAEGPEAADDDGDDAPTEVSERDALEDALALLRTADAPPLTEAGAPEEEPEAEDDESATTAEDLVSLELLAEAEPSDADVDPAILGDLADASSITRRAVRTVGVIFGAPAPPRPWAETTVGLDLGEPRPVDPEEPDLEVDEFEPEADETTAPGFQVDLALARPVAPDPKTARRGVAVPPPDVRARSVPRGPSGPATDLLALSRRSDGPPEPDEDTVAVDVSGDDWLNELPELEDESP